MPRPAYPRNSEQTQQRFWAKVRKTDTCWLWEGYTCRGYGRFRDTGKTLEYAHRYSLSLVEPLDDKLVVDHLCGVKNCVNPAHLEQVTNAVNMLRGWQQVVSVNK